MSSVVGGPTPFPTPMAATESNGAGKEPPSKFAAEPALCLQGHKRSVASVKFSPDGRLLASACASAPRAAADPPRSTVSAWS